MQIVQEKDKLVARIDDFHWFVTSADFNNHGETERETFSVIVSTSSKAKGQAVRDGIIQADDNPFWGLEAHTAICKHGYCNCDVCNRGYMADRCPDCMAEATAANILACLIDPEKRARSDLKYRHWDFVPEISDAEEKRHAG